MAIRPSSAATSRGHHGHRANRAARIVTDDGVLHELDVIVYATVSTPMPTAAMTITRGRRTLDEAWADGPRAYRTVALPGSRPVHVDGPHSPIGTLVDRGRRTRSRLHRRLDRADARRSPVSVVPDRRSHRPPTTTSSRRPSQHHLGHRLSELVFGRRWPTRLLAGPRQTRKNADRRAAGPTPDQAQHLHRDARSRRAGSAGKWWWRRRGCSRGSVLTLGRSAHRGIPQDVSPGR